MPRCRHRAIILLLLPALSCGSWAESFDLGTVGLDSLKRLISHVSFEEASEVPVDMPVNFYRILSRNNERPGFPEFGRMQLDGTVAADGRWSFRFDLAGGSMGAAMQPAVIPVLVGSDYRVTAMVMTRGLVQARAQVAAQLLDAHGRPIKGARFASEPLMTHGDWGTVSIDVKGGFPDAVDMSLELELLQPRALPHPADLRTRPLLEDVSGHVWFDDLRVWLVPAIEFTTNSRSNAFQFDEPAEFRISVRDVSNERLMMDLDIVDQSGTIKQIIEGAPAPVGSRPMITPLPAGPAGWYRAILSVRNDRAVIARRSIDLARINPMAARPAKPTMSFGVALRGRSDLERDVAPALIKAANATEAIVPIWEGDDGSNVHVDSDRLRSFCDALLDQQTRVTVAFTDLPQRVAEAHHLDPSQALEYLSTESTGWRMMLEEALLSLGQHLHRWQIGNVHRSIPFWGEDQSDALQRVEAGLNSLIPGPCVVIPWSIATAAPSPPIACSSTLIIPAGATEDQIAMAAEEWKANLDSTSVLLETLPNDTFTTSDRMTDLAFGVIRSWEHGFRQLLIEAPWMMSDDMPAQPQPQPELIVWREISQRLNGRTFVGELALGDGLRCLIARGDKTSSLIAWRETCPEDRAVIRAALSSTSVDVFDLLGNRLTVDPVDGIHEVRLGSDPVFIEGVDAGLAQFRGGFHLDPMLVPSLHQVHEHEIVLANPFSVTISGTLRIVEPAQWEFMPRTQTFTIPPGQTQRLPVRLSFPRGELAGEKRLVADVNFNGERAYSIRLESPIEVGLPGVDFQAHWRIAQSVTDGRADLVVYEYVTNTGSQILSLEAFAVAPEYHHKRKPIVDLPPGQSAVRIFHFPDGVQKLRGITLRVGVTETEGPGRLNREITIPD